MMAWLVGPRGDSSWVRLGGGALRIAVGWARVSGGGVWVGGVWVEGARRSVRAAS